MKKVWNPQTRQYDWEQEGLWVDQQDYDLDGAWNKWRSRRGEKAGRKVVVKQILKKMVDDKESYSKHHEFIAEVERRIIEVNKAYVNTYLGKSNKKMLYSAIPIGYKQGIASIVRGAAQGYSRGKHTTRPSISAAVQNFQEYQLTATGDGRATTAEVNGMLLVYYSTTHAAATYNYHLVTAKFKGHEVPVMGGKRDEMIEWPF